MFSNIFSIMTRMQPYKYSGQSEPCNLCGANEKIAVGQRDRYLNELHTVLCGHCGLVFTDPMPTVEEISHYYQKHYRKHYHNAEQPTKRAIFKNFKGAINRYEKIKPFLSPGVKLIDIGSGGGEFVSYLNEQGVKASGIEPNEGFAAYARAAYQIQIINGMWETASIPSEGVDVITAFHVLEHFRDPLAAFSKFWQWLSPGGLLHITVPNIVNPKGTSMSRFHFAHLYNFSPETLLMMAKKVGFEVTSQSMRNNTDMIFKKLDSPCSDWFIAPSHANEMQQFFKTYTNRRYFLSYQPYVRWISRMRKLTTILFKSAVSSNPKMPL